MDPEIPLSAQAAFNSMPLDYAALLCSGLALLIQTVETGQAHVIEPEQAAAILQYIRDHGVSGKWIITQLPERDYRKSGGKQ